MSDEPFLRWHTRQYLLEDPYLEVRFYDPDRWPLAAFLHTPEKSDLFNPPGDVLHFNDEHNYERYFRPSPNLLKALRRVFNGE